MSYELTKWAIQEIEIPQTCKAVLIAICSYCNSENEGFPSQELIAKCASIDPKTANRTIAKLVKMGIITILKKGVYRVNKVKPNHLEGDLKSPKVIISHLKQGDLKSPKSDPQSPQSDLKSPPYNKPINKPINKSEREQKQENRFQEFWLKYPVSRREGLEKTKTAYRVVIEKITEPILFKALEAQLAIWAKEKTEDKFKKYILRWLQDGAWQKFIEAPKAQGQTGETYQELINRIDAGRASWTREHTLKYQLTEARARSLINEKKCEAA